MNTKQFLQAILPTTGIYFFATKVGSAGAWRNVAIRDLDSLVNISSRATFEHTAAYYAMAGYKEARYFDPDFVDPRSGQKGKWRTRTQQNAGWIKSFYVDLDVDPADPVKKFPSKQAALAELMQFVADLGLPRPIVVDSGGGIHAYWPMTEEVPTSEWKPVAELFKAICVAKGFKADRSLTSDEARVLRVPGGFNTKRGSWVRILYAATGRTTLEAFSTILAAYAVPRNITVAVLRSQGASTGLGLPGNQSDIFGDNTQDQSGPTPLFDQIIYKCRHLGQMVGNGGKDASEPQWRAALSIAKYADQPDAGAILLSKGHRDFNQTATMVKMAGWSAPPARCENFQACDPSACANCPFNGKISSPIQLGKPEHFEADKTPRVVEVEQPAGLDAAPKTRVIPAPPKGYYREKGTGAIYHAGERETDDGTQAHDIMICPHDFYPVCILRQEGETVSEQTLWRAHLPRMTPVDIAINQSVLADSRRLYAFLMDKGVLLTPEQAKGMQFYMSAYLQLLAKQADRERLYERLGWHDDHKTFVLGDRSIHATGEVRDLHLSEHVKAATRDSIKPKGDLKAWKDAMEFYNQDGYQGHRMFLYASLAAPLFHMNQTGTKGVLMTASGKSGRGKTTCLKACASIWGNPDGAVVNGNREGSTVNAMYEQLGAYHSLPYLWDDITERDPEELRRFLLNISQGVGKTRMKDGQNLVQRRSTWETIVLASANTDDITRIMSTGKDVSPHLMRMIGVEFNLIDSTAPAKAAADEFQRQLVANYGHVGPQFMRVVTQGYAKVQAQYIKNIAKVDVLMDSADAAAERYWTAVVAAAYTAAHLARHLGLIPNYPIEEDLQWMVAHMKRQRTTMSDTLASAPDLLAEFMDSRLGNTLTLHPSRVMLQDGILVRPYNELAIRHDMDTGEIAISRKAISRYCAEERIDIRSMENDLRLQGVLLDAKARRTLGAGTSFATGQVPVWIVNAKKLEIITGAPLPSTDARKAREQAGNVISMRKPA